MHNGSGRPARPIDAQRLARRIRVALGSEPGDCVLTGGLVVDVFTEQVRPANVVIADGWIAGVGPFDWPAERNYDVTGQCVLPGLIDAHIHLESTLLSPAELARLVVPHGTSAVIADPHEVGNVVGIAGIDQLLASSADLPLDFFFNAPSCVPASEWESSGAVLDAGAIGELLARPRVLGLAEVMDFPALLAGSEPVLEKILIARALGGAVDGHAPGLLDRQLQAYCSAGVRSCHESTTVEEGLQKAASGMLVQVREGSAARNLETMIPLILARRLGDWALCTDDIFPEDLVRDGHIDGLLRRLVSAGVPAPHAVRHASLVPARHYGLRDRGAVAPGYRADLIVADNLTNFVVSLVLKAGEPVAQSGVYRAKVEPVPLPLENSVRLAPLDAGAFDLSLAGEECPVVEIVPDQIVTRQVRATVARESGRWRFDPNRDILLAANIERHQATGEIGLGLVRGFGITRPGAIGSSVWHDAHNLIVCGTGADELLSATRALESLGGGWVVIAAGQLVASLPLPYAGLLSVEPYETVCTKIEQVNAAARSLGCPLSAPFGTLSFLALSVIPELRVTTKGVLDVVGQKILTV